MKKVAFIVILILLAISAQAQTKTVKKDSVPLFYGLTVEKILSLTVPEAKTLIKEKKISVSDYLGAKLKAENYLIELEIKRDRVKLDSIYGRIEKKLGIKKNDGKTKG